MAEEELSFTLAHTWPFVALTVGTLLLAHQIANAGRYGRLDVCFKSLLAIYMLHQFEEHGYDFLGRRYAFHGEFCRVMGYSLRDCPATPAWIMGVNVGFVWPSGCLAMLTSDHAYGMPMLGLVFGNSLVHLLAFLVKGDYNPGLGTGTVIFLPLSLYMFWLLWKDNEYSGTLLFLIAIPWGLAFTHGLTILNALARYYDLLSPFVSVAFWYVISLPLNLLLRNLIRDHANRAEKRKA